MNTENIDPTLHDGESDDSNPLRISVESLQAQKSVVTISRPWPEGLTTRTVHRATERKQDAAANPLLTKELNGI
jgi:hypothetical protein